MKYAVVVEKAMNNYSAYVPDLPGCVATGKTIDETIDLMREAIHHHIVLMRESGMEIPEPSSRATMIDAKESALSPSPL